MHFRLPAILSTLALLWNAAYGPLILEVHDSRLTKGEAGSATEVDRQPVLGNDELTSVVRHPDPRTTTHSCLPRFRKFKEEYNQCKTQHCLLFISESAFVRVPESMNSSEHQRLFPCIQHRKQHPGLGGVSFQILQETSNPDALCVFAGWNCSFNQMVYFMAEQAKDGYRFSTLTAMLQTRDRRKISRCSHPFHEGKIAVIGPTDLAKPMDPGELLSRPFRKYAWGVVISCALVLLVFALIIEFRFRHIHDSFSGFILSVYREKRAANQKQKPANTNEDENIGSDNDDSSEAQGNKDERTILHERVIPDGRKDIVNRMLYRWTWWIHGIVVLFFLSLTVIFYEASIVNFLFRQSSAKLSKNLSSLSKEELRKYCVEGHQAVEDVFRELVDPEGRMSHHDFPWHRADQSDECFLKLIDPKDPIRFMVSFTGEAAYLAKKYGSRSKVAVYEPEGEQFSFSMCFLNNFAVPEKVLIKLDTDLLELRKVNFIRRLLQAKVGPPLTDKADGPTDIDWPILALAFLIIAGPPLLALVIVLALSLLFT